MAHPSQPNAVHPDLSPHLQPRKEARVPMLQAISKEKTWVNSGSLLPSETHGPGLQPCDQVTPRC